MFIHPHPMLIYIEINHAFSAFSPKFIYRTHHQSALYMEDPTRMPIVRLSFRTCECGYVYVCVWLIVFITGSSLISHSTIGGGWDLPDVQFRFSTSPIWYWRSSPVMCGPSRGRSASRVVCGWCRGITGDAAWYDGCKVRASQRRWWWWWTAPKAKDAAVPSDIHTRGVDAGKGVDRGVGRRLYGASRAHEKEKINTK